MGVTLPPSSSFSLYVSSRRCVTRPAAREDGAAHRVSASRHAHAAWEQARLAAKPGVLAREGGGQHASHPPTEWGRANQPSRAHPRAVCPLAPAAAPARPRQGAAGCAAHQALPARGAGASSSVSWRDPPLPAARASEASSVQHMQAVCARLPLPMPQTTAARVAVRQDKR